MGKQEFIWKLQVVEFHLESHLTRCWVSDKPGTVGCVFQEYIFSTFPRLDFPLAVATLQCCPHNDQLRDSIYIYGLIINSSECIVVVFFFFIVLHLLLRPTHRNSLCQNIEASGLASLLLLHLNWSSTSWERVYFKGGSTFCVNSVWIVCLLGQFRCHSFAFPGVVIVIAF